MRHVAVGIGRLALSRSGACSRIVKLIGLCLRLPACVIQVAIAACEASALFIDDTIARLQARRTHRLRRPDRPQLLAWVSSFAATLDGRVLPAWRDEIGLFVCEGVAADWEACVGRLEALTSAGREMEVDDV